MNIYRVTVKAGTDDSHAPRNKILGWCFKHFGDCDINKHNDMLSAPLQEGETWCWCSFHSPITSDMVKLHEIYTEFNFVNVVDYDQFMSTWCDVIVENTDNVKYPVTSFAGITATA